MLYISISLVKRVTFSLHNFWWYHMAYNSTGTPFDSIKMYPLVRRKSVSLKLSVESDSVKANSTINK